MKWWGDILDRCAGMGDLDHRGDAGRKGIVAVVTRCWRLIARHAGSRRR
jgi:hypothetical protein